MMEEFSLNISMFQGCKTFSLWKLQNDTQLLELLYFL